MTSPALIRIAISPKEAAAKLGVSDSTFRLWMKEEGLPYCRVRGRVFVLVDELLDWLRAHHEDPADELDRRVDAIVHNLVQGR